MVADISARVPNVLYGAPATLTSSDGGLTYGFGSDAAGYALTPTGKVKIFTSLSAVPHNPWREGWDYLSEGSIIRIPNNRSYPGPLYWRGISPPVDIDASHQPALLPEASRELIVIEAVRDFASQGDRLPSLRDAKASEYGLEFARWCLVWRTQFVSGGALACPSVAAGSTGSGATLTSIIVAP